MNKYEKKEINRVYLGLILISLGIVFIFSKAVSNKTSTIYDEELAKLSFQEKVLVEEDLKDKEKYQYFIGNLKIDKIDLNTSFVDINNPNNNVQKHVTIIKGSTIPDTKFSTFILAGHSGYGPLAYFNDLEKLEKGDIAKLTYKDKVYEYKLYKKYLDSKNGSVGILKPSKISALVLITCTNDRNDTHTVYIFERIK